VGPTVEPGSGETIDEVRALLEGPVNSTQTTFGPDGSLDLDGGRAVAAVMPVMLVGCRACSLPDQLVEDARICCFKEDGTEGCAVQTLHRDEGRWKMMTGGGLRRHFTQWPFDCRAFMS
jgi:hypothetical protein